jgi:hypothetical protein
MLQRTNLHLRKTVEADCWHWMRVYRHPNRRTKKPTTVNLKLQILELSEETVSENPVSTCGKEWSQWGQMEISLPTLWPRNPMARRPSCKEAYD